MTHFRGILSLMFALMSAGLCTFTLVLSIQAVSRADDTLPTGPEETGRVIYRGNACQPCTGQCDDSNASDCYSNTSCNNCSCSCTYYAASNENPYDLCACS